MTSESAQNGGSKALLRRSLLGARAARSRPDLLRARALIARAAIRRADSIPCVAAYVPLATEPASIELLNGLIAQGTTVLVPVLLPDRDLAWQCWPDGPAADIDAAALLFVPALAIDRAGFRLGRGGGSYDRVLARLRPGVATVALLFDGELIETVPTDPWDRPVTEALMPSTAVTFASTPE